MAEQEVGWRADLERWLEPYLARLSHPARWAMCSLYAAGLIGLTVYSAAYYSEIFRAGFNAVPTGHIEAAACVGLTRGQLIRRIVVPEMAMLVLPQLVNMIILMMKETAVLSIVTVPFSSSTLVLTTSMPTPRPERSLTVAAVEKPGSKIS